MISDALTNEAEIDRQLTSFIERTGSHLAEFDVLNYESALWPHLYLLDVTKDDRLKVRVMGQHIREVVGQSCTGRCLDEFMHGPKSRDVLGAYAACARDGLAVRMFQRVILPERPIVTVFACAVPLVDEGRVARLAGLMHGVVTPSQYTLTEAESIFEAKWMPKPSARISVTG